MRVIFLLLFCLIVPVTAHAVDLHSVQGQYTGNNPLAPYTGNEPYQFGGTLDADTGEFCLSVTKPELKTTSSMCYAVEAKPGGSNIHTLRNGNRMAELHVLDERQMMFSDKVSPDFTMAVLLMREGELSPRHAIDTGATLPGLAGVWRVDPSTAPPEMYEKHRLRTVTLTLTPPGSMTLVRGEKSRQGSLVEEKSLPGRFVFKSDDVYLELRAHRNGGLSLGAAKEDGPRKGVIHLTRNPKEGPQGEIIPPLIIPER